MPQRTLALAAMRVSQISGGSACLRSEVDMARDAGVSEDQLATVAAWRNAPYFFEAERAALSLAEAAAKLPASPANPVPDDLWHEVTHHYDERQRAELILWISLSKLFNTINAVIRAPAGTTWS